MQKAPIATPTRGLVYPVVALLLLELFTVLYPVRILGELFRFPEILRQPAAVALPLFRSHQGAIIGAYYIFLVSSLLYLPLAVLLPQALAPAGSAGRGWLRASTQLGVAAGIFQAIGFSRWIFAVPILAAQPASPQADLLYEILNRYLGMTVGEHLGFLAMGGWTICLGVGMGLQPGQRRFRQVLAISGAVIGLLIALSTLEHFGGPSAHVFGLLNFIANILWALWVVGIMLLLLLPAARRVTKPAPALA